MRFTGGRVRPLVEVADLAEKLGLDPAETTRVEVEILPSGAAVMRWEGFRELTPFERDQIMVDFIRGAGS